MNANRLLGSFDKTFGAPHAIPHLHRFILELAVRGKLVDQDPKDEPASVLLKQIAAEKPRLVSTKAIKARRASGIEVHSALPFDLPTGWSPVRVEQILVEIQTGPFGSSLHQSDYQLGGVPVVNPASIQNEQIVPISKMAVGPTTLARLSSFKLQTDDIVMARRGEMGRCAVVSERESGWLCGTGSLILRPFKCIYPRFLSMLIGSPLSRQYLGGTAVGTTMQNLNQTILLNLPFGLPPLAEQHRIVAKVDELMALCDQLEAARTERETTRNRLATASLARLNTPDPDPITFQNHAAFALENLTLLTTRPDQIKALRQTILNLAVLGKLVPQDPSGEPATELLEHIASERVPKKRKTKTTIELNSSISESDLPPGWVVATLQSVCGSITDGDHLPPPKTESGIPFLVIGNVRSQTIEFTGSRFVSPEYYKALALIRRPSRGDLLYTLVGSYGIPVVVRDDRPFCVQRHIGILRPSRFIDVDFLACAMGSRSVFEQATACATGIAQKTVPLSGLRRLLIPLPPLTEQRRIVAKVDELMTLCDRLETTLAAVGNTRCRLLDAVLHDALAPRTEPKTAAGRLGYASGEGRRF